jgi:hypothetical protein
LGGSKFKLMKSIIALEQTDLNDLMEKIDKLYEAFCNSKVQTNKQEEWIQPQAALNLLGVSSRTLQNYRDTGAVGFSQVSRKKILYRRADIEKMLEGKYVQPFKTEGKHGNK